MKEISVFGANNLYISDGNFCIFLRLKVHQLMEKNVKSLKTLFNLIVLQENVVDIYVITARDLTMLTDKNNL